MIKAYVLAKVQPNFEKSAIERIKKIPGVKNIDMTFGQYDFVVTVDASDEVALKNVVMDEVRKLPDITKTLTLIVAQKV